MVKFRQPDEAIRRYVDLSTELTSLQSIDLFPSIGAICARCGGGPAIVSGKRKKLLCLHCRQPWDGEEIREGPQRQRRTDSHHWAPKPPKRVHSNGSGLERRLGELADIASAIAAIRPLRPSTAM